MVLAGALGVLLTLSVVRAADHTRPVLAAARDLPAGTVLDAGALRVTRVHADRGVNASLFGVSEQGALRGRVLATSVAAGALLTRASVRNADANRAPHEMSFSVPRARALDGALTRGDHLDIVAVDHDTGRAVYVMRDVVLLAIDAHGGGALSGTSEDVTVTVNVDATSAPRLAAAVDTEVVSVVRTAGIS
jgi:hypothetical protein